MAVEVSQKTASGTQPSDVWETLQAFDLTISSAEPTINSGELEDLIAQLKEMQYDAIAHVIKN